MAHASVIRGDGSLPGEIAVTRSRLHWRDWLIVSLFTAAYLVPFTQALPFVDGIRDLQFALDIARGEHFPLLGPIFGSRFHLGPVYYYVQALPLVLGASLATVPVFLGLLASTKFALAYRLGRAWMDRRLGLLFAAALAIPGWSGLDIVNTTTPMLVPALLLLTAGSALSYFRGGTTLALAGVGLASVLAVHAHPSAAVIAGLLVAAAAWRAIRRRHWRGLGAAALAAGLPLFPVIIAVAQSGTDAVYPAGVTVVQAGSGHSLEGWLDALRGFFLGGPLTTLRTLGSADWGGVLAVAAVATGSGGGVLAAIAAVAGNRGAQILLAAFGTVAVAVFAVRASTPWYFVQSLTLVYAATSAYGWATWRRAASVLPAVILLQALTQSGLMLDHVGRGEGNFPAAELMDVRRARGEIGPQVGAWFSVGTWDELADQGCSLLRQGSLALHGELAVMVDDYGALPLRAECDISGLSLGGPARRSMVGIPRAVWGPLGWPPLAKIGSLGLFDASAWVTTGAGHRPADPRRYPLRQPIGSVASTREHQVHAPGAAVLVVSRLSPALSEFRVDAVHVDGQAVAPIYQDARMRAFRAPQPAGDRVAWSVTVTSTAHEWVDLVAIAPPARATGQR